MHANETWHQPETRFNLWVKNKLPTRLQIWSWWTSHYKCSLFRLWSDNFVDSRDRCNIAAANVFVSLVKFLFQRLTFRTKTEQYKESPHIMTLGNWSGLSRKSRRSRRRRRRISMSLHRASITGSCGIIWRGARSECPGKQEVSALTSKCGSV